jgi:cytosine/adenosine deaminase-related metal-dependent hydrolase
VNDHRITSCGPRSEVGKNHDGEIRDLGDVVLLPGLINAHSHLELSWMSEEDLPRGDYLDWLRGFARLRDSENEERAHEAATRAIGAVLGRGTVAVGDIANHAWMPGLLARSALWAVVFHELFAFRSSDAESRLRTAAGRLDQMEADTRSSDGRVCVALTPHAPHTTSARLLKALAGRAAATGSRLSVHVAESEMESAFLRGGAAEYRRFLIERGAWDDHWSSPGQSPVEYLDRLHVLSPRTLAVHCVHLGQRDLSRLQARGTTVITCPRSNERLGVGAAPVPKLLGAGIPVALGTDSLASAPDLDLFAEISTLLHLHPGLSPLAALRMASLNGAVALGIGDRLGSIAPGKVPALIVVPLSQPGADPLEFLADGPETVLPLESAPWESRS